MAQAEEKIFLLNLALNQYNAQYGHSIQVADCDIRSIPTRVMFDRGYEINTLRLDDALRMRLYINFGNVDQANMYKVEVIAPYINGALGDEVFVMTASVDKFYIEHAIFRFRELQDDVNALPIFISEDGIAYIDDLTGEYFDITT